MGVLQRFWTKHRLATVLCLALLFLGLLLQPWSLVLVLAVSFGGPLLKQLESLKASPISTWRRSHWIGVALVLSVLLLALTGGNSGRGALILALLPVGWVLITDRGLFQDKKEIERGSTDEPLALSTTDVEEECHTKPPEPLVGTELIAKVKELGDVSKSDLVRACGYVSNKKDGGERLNFTAFYKALLEAKGQTSTNKTPGSGNINTEECMVENSERNNDETEIYLKVLQSGKYLVNLLYVNQILAERGFNVDNHQAYIFIENVLIGEEKKKGFLYVNMDGIHSDCVEPNSLSLLFNWSMLDRIAIKTGKPASSLTLVSKQYSLNIAVDPSGVTSDYSLETLVAFWENVWKPIWRRFENCPFIQWNLVHNELNIKEIGVQSKELLHATLSPLLNGVNNNLWDNNSSDNNLNDKSGVQSTAEDIDHSEIADEYTERMEEFFLTPLDNQPCSELNVLTTRLLFAQRFLYLSLGFVEEDARYAEAIYNYKRSIAAIKELASKIKGSNPEAYKKSFDASHGILKKIVDELKDKRDWTAADVELVLRMVTTSNLHRAYEYCRTDKDEQTADALLLATGYFQTAIDAELKVDNQKTEQNSEHREYDQFWKEQEETALKHGRSVLGFNLKDEEGNDRYDKYGKPLLEFSYTYGNRQTGDAELLTFYPAQNTVHAVLNRLSKGLAEGRLPYPRNHREMVCAEGLLEETNTVVMYHALDVNQRAFTNKRYTTHHWQDEANIPILNVVVPLPDGNFAPGTPQPLMPNDQYTVVEASYEDSNWVKPKPNYLPRLIHEPDTENWGKANLKIIMNWIKDWTTDLLLAAAIDAKNNNTARKTIDWKDSFEWSLEELEKFDPDITSIARMLDESTKRKIIEGVFAGLNGIALVDDHIELTIALLSAKGVDDNSEGNKQEGNGEENANLAKNDSSKPEGIQNYNSIATKEFIAVDKDNDYLDAIKLVPYLVMKGSSIRIPRPCNEEELIMRRTSPSYSNLFDFLEREKILRDGLNCNSNLEAMIKSYSEELTERIDKMFGDWYNNNQNFWSKYGQYSYPENLEKAMTLYDGAFDELNHHFSFNIDENILVIKLSIGDKTVDLTTTKNSGYSRKEKATFVVNTLIVINDITAGSECHRGSSTHEVGSFKIQLSENWINNLIAFSESNSQVFEKFQQCFHDDGAEIESSINDILGHPRFDDHDGLAEIDTIHMWNSGNELEELCTLLGESKSYILGILLQFDGFIIDTVHNPTDVADSCKELRSGDIDSEEFMDILSEMGLEFEVECHMIFNAILDSEHLVSKLSDHIDPENEDKLSILCKNLINSLPFA